MRDFRADMRAGERAVISVIVHLLEPQRNDPREPKLRAEAFVFGSVAALLLTIGTAHAAGPTQAELNNAATDGVNWPFDLAKTLGVNVEMGAVVNEVIADSPADKAGIKAGDVITKVNSQPVLGASGLRNKIGLMSIGSELHITLIR
jgi:membrane-associated protease RseP (regulator of RpoE activity)